MTDWAISLHAPHWDAIVAGTKIFELRRRLPSIKPGDRVHVYVTRPVKAVCGSFEVASVLREDSADALWEKTRGNVSSTSQDAFRQYFDGSATCCALGITDVVSFSENVKPWFSAPQNFSRLHSTIAF